MNKYEKLIITTTRVKKYKKYRKSIKSDYNTYIKKESKSDDLYEIERNIAKIDKTLLLNKVNEDIFYVNFTNTWTDGDRTIVPAKNYLENIRNCNFTELLNRASVVKNDIEQEPHFDKFGNLSSVWLEDDSKYSDLLELKKWINSMIDNKSLIINNAKERIFLFKDAYYKSINSSTIQQILPTQAETVSFKVNKKNKKMFFIFLFSFFTCSILAIIFLILFFLN